MKKILITGANSYIGTSVEKYLTENYPSDITFDTIDMTNDDWKIHSFHGYDCVFHVAGIRIKRQSVFQRNLCSGIYN